MLLIKFHNLLSFTSGDYFWIEYYNAFSKNAILALLVIFSLLWLLLSSSADMLIYIMLSSFLHYIWCIRNSKLLHDSIMSICYWLILLCLWSGSTETLIIIYILLPRLFYIMICLTGAINFGFCQETCKDLEGQHPRRNVALKLQAYALRFLKCNGSHGISSQTEALATPDRISDSGNVDMSWQELLTEVWAKLPYKYLVNILILMLVIHLSLSFSLSIPCLLALTC